MDDERNDVEFEASDDEGGALTGVQKLKELREKLKQAEKEKQEYLDGWQRAKADYVNLQKQLDEARIRAKTITEEQFFDDLLPVLDSFYFAFNNKEAWEAVDANWRTGVEYIYGQLKGILEARGLSSYDDTGAPFDPFRHQAVTEIETEDTAQAGTIAATLKLGFIYKDTVLRPASVSVYTLKK
ncbi:MAG TPA: nucleotide exchange factor GrpE [Candidatus Paceibacterota bacterium]|nr:nucleotide exchange factor GrpE [Candidatus Paceibacterota bacterium]